MIILELCCRSLDDDRRIRIRIRIFKSEVRFRIRTKMSPDSATLVFRIEDLSSFVIILEPSFVDPCDDDHAADPAAPQGPAPDVLLCESGSPYQAGSDQVSSQLTYLIPTWWVILDGAGSAAQRMSVRGCNQHSSPVWTAVLRIRIRIRIRKDPKLLAGSGSDPEPK